MSLTDVAVIATVLLSIANSAAIVALVRTANAPTIPPHGLAIGTVLPTFDIESLAGVRNTERDLAGRIVLFLGGTCPPCHVIARELARTKASGINRLWILVVGQIPEQGENLIETLKFMARDQIAYDPTRGVAERLGVSATPFAYAIDRTGRIADKTTVPSLAHLRDLERRVHWA